MKPKPDINSFLNAGAVDKANNLETEFKTPKKIHKEQKIFRLPLDIINALKREAYEQSTSSGQRITETMLVEKALKKFLKI